MTPAPGTTVRAIVIDLDDTLYPQKSFLRGAAKAVGARAQELGVDARRFESTFMSVLERGSDSGNTIDIALSELGFPQREIHRLRPQLVTAFLEHRPYDIECYPQVLENLTMLARHVPLACLTDGAPDLQHAKIKALGVAEFFTLIVVTDELGGRTFRKPNTSGLQRIAEVLAVPITSLFIIGDRPDKDIALALDAHVNVIRIQQGEYCDVPSPPGVTTVGDFPSAARIVLDIMDEN